MPSMRFGEIESLLARCPHPPFGHLLPGGEGRDGSSADQTLISKPLRCSRDWKLLAC